FADATVVEVRLETGLKNQIRVQFRAEGHPLVGDQHYAWEEKGRTRLNRQALHAWRLSFRHPVTEATLRLEAPPPADLDRLLARLRRRDGRPPP
ncbi:MAG: RluA family pseudouridine synthase, partial [Deltaproteobacteria bacterium]|nr:RluA family pseudouridine synthase [Deltaproteobacteria bacterium]